MDFLYLVSLYRATAIEAQQPTMVFIIMYTQSVHMHAWWAMYKDIKTHMCWTNIYFENIVVMVQPHAPHDGKQQLCTISIVAYILLYCTGTRRTILITHLLSQRYVSGNHKLSTSKLKAPIVGQHHSRSFCETCSDGVALLVLCV